MLFFIDLERKPNYGRNYNGVNYYVGATQETARSGRTLKAFNK